MRIDIITPYNAIASPSATKIRALPNTFGSSLVAPIAAGAAAAIAIPPPIPARPVTSAAERYFKPLEESAETSSSSAFAEVTTGVFASAGSPPDANAVTAKTETNTIKRRKVRMFTEKAFLGEFVEAILFFAKKTESEISTIGIMNNKAVMINTILSD